MKISLEPILKGRLHEGNRLGVLVRHDHEFSGKFERKKPEVSSQ
ncbi:Uncharacterised protein [uncultured archaeon]|nr:Uncharacterised protein [uncultured archaeon]